MQNQYGAVISILDRIYKENLIWYRKADDQDVDFFSKRVSSKFSPLDQKEIHNIGHKPQGNFSAKKLLVMQPHSKEVEPALGMWLKWDFRSEPFEFRLFLGQWSIIDGNNTFIAFRFETPEVGDEHDFFHCQPCRNFGDRENLPESAQISHRFPTIPLNASNIVELTLCALMSTLGRKKTRRFMRSLMTAADPDVSEVLQAAYSRCCKN